MMDSETKELITLLDARFGGQWNEFIESPGKFYLLIAPKNRRDEVVTPWACTAALREQGIQFENLDRGIFFLTKAQALAGIAAIEEGSEPLFVRERNPMLHAAKATSQAPAR